ncbi:MAG TPA: lamin tail domain-containing protein [Blastocatellia bacterium]|nr:lamin tail domain-containing protein [Blastocatellia bacterium]
MFTRSVLKSLCGLLVIPHLLFSTVASQSALAPSTSQDFSPQVATLIINEYLADPPPAGGDANGDGVISAANDEFVEVVNNSAVALDVSLFTISDATSVRFTFPASKMIPPGEAAVVFGGGTPTGAFGNAAANGLVFTTSGGLSLNNAGDTITIKDNTAAVVATLTFGSSEGNADQSITRNPDITGGFVTHSTATGSGGSLFSPGARVDGASLTPPNPLISSITPTVAIAASGDVTLMVTGSHFQMDGTVRVDGSAVSTTFQSANLLSATIPSAVTSVPGAHAVTVENPGPATSNAKFFTVLPGVGINEYLADPPDGPAGDANGDGTRDSAQDEFVEIVNRTSTPAGVGGFTISDADGVRFTFPPGTVIPANEVAVIFGGGTPTGDFGNAHANGLVFTAALSLNNGGDTITLKDNAANVVEFLTYGSSEGGANQSITRNPDGSGDFVTHSTAAGSGGSLFSPGTRADGTFFTAPHPVISSVSPDSGVSGNGAVPITVNGTHFDPAANVLVDGSPISTSFQGDMTLTATVPASVTNVPGPHAVRVENPGSILSNAVNFTVLSAIGINEYLADPPGSAAGDLSGDANHDGVHDSSQDEFVEVVNRTNSPIDVGGYSLSDADALRFTFPSGTIIPANEAAVIFGGGTPTGEFGNAGPNGLVFTAALSLNNSGDRITLKNNLGATIESFTFGAAEGGADQSINRNPDVVGTKFATHSSIAESGGRLFSPGAAIDGAPFTVGPRVTTITPDSAPKGDPPFDLTVMGAGFESGSQVVIDAIQTETMFVGPGELKARVPASVTAASGRHSVRVRNEGGNRSNPATLTIVPPPPFLSQVLPRLVVLSSGQFTLFLTGLNFEGASVVLVEGAAVPTTFVSAHELRASLAGSLITTLGIRRVVVQNSDGKLSNEDSFEVISPLAVLTSLAPTIAIAGSPGFPLSIRGANFKNTAVARFDQTDLATTFVSATQLSAQVPASLISGPGIHAVSARNLGEQTSNELIFQVLPDPPLVASLDPTSVIEGSGDLTLTLNGSKFQPGAVVRVVGERGPGAMLDTTFISSERLQARVSSALTRTAGVVLLGVENPDLGFSSGAPFKVLIKDPIVINEYLVDPPEGAAGDANGDRTRSSSSDEFVEILNRTSEPLDISGYKLSDADAVRHVFATGTVLPPFESTVVFGGGTPAGSFGNAAENHLVFKASSGGLSLNNGGDTIKLQDAQDRMVQEIKVDAAQGGAGQAINRDPDGDGATFTLHTIVAVDVNRLFSPGTKATGETFTVKPAIRSLSPPSVRVGSPQFSMSVSGSKFLPGSVVMLGDTALVTTYVSDSQLDAQVSPSLTSTGGAVDIRVRNPKGELSGIARLLIVDDPPRASQISPLTAGTGAQGLEVTVTGERFQRGAGVFVQGARVETKFVSATSLAVALPASLFVRAAELSLLVQNADGNRSNIISLVVENGPLITRLSKGKVKAGRGIFDLTLRGVAFKPGILLFANDTAISTTFVSETELTVRIPAQLTNEPGTLMLQARHPDGGRSNTVKLKVVQ